jgi:diaminopimelate epimerase
MSGAGNDFVVVDNTRGELSSVLTRGFISRICRRGTGIGADGLLELLPPAGEGAFSMGYYNSDGGRASMCGNGARCICRFAATEGLVKEGEEFLFTSDSGTHRGLVTSRDTARVWMTEPSVAFLERVIPSGPAWPVSLVDTGVPHAVIVRDHIHDGSFERWAGALRSHPGLGPGGANADWVKPMPDGSLEIRTFERGVEGETLACGTGAVAAALVMLKTAPGFRLPVEILVKSGMRLTVGRDSSGWWLDGQAAEVYRGALTPEESEES